MAEPTEPVAITGKKRRQTAACDPCRHRRVKCDGALPCDQCEAKSFQCTYSPQKRRGKKPKKNPPGDGLMLQSLSPADGALMTSASRTLYFTAFFDSMYPYHHIGIHESFVEPFLIDDPNLSRQVLFQHHVALALSSRALGHESVTAALQGRCLQMASELFDDFKAETAVGFAMLAMFFQTDNSRRAEHYARIALNLAQKSTWDHPKSRLVLDYIFVWYPELQNEAHALMFPNVRSPINNVVGTISDIIKKFPRHSPFSDLGCQVFGLRRERLENRSDNLSTLETMTEYKTNVTAMVQSLMDIPEPAASRASVVGYLLASEGCWIMGCAACNERDAALSSCHRVLQLLQSRLNQIMLFLPAFLQCLLHISNVLVFFKAGCGPDDFTTSMRKIADLLSPYRTQGCVDSLFQLVLQHIDTPSATIQLDSVGGMGSRLNIANPMTPHSMSAAGMGFMHNYPYGPMGYMPLRPMGAMGSMMPMPPFPRFPTPQYNFMPPGRMGFDAMDMSSNVGGGAGAGAGMPGSAGVQAPSFKNSPPTARKEAGMVPSAAASQHPPPPAGPSSIPIMGGAGPSASSAAAGLATMSGMTLPPIMSMPGVSSATNGMNGGGHTSSFQRVGGNGSSVWRSMSTS